MITQQPTYPKTRAQVLKSIFSMGGRSWRFFFVSVALCIASKAYAGTNIQYFLTTQNNPVKPGNVVEFDATVRNLGTGLLSVTLTFTVPEHVTYNDDNDHGAGSNESLVFTNIPQGESRTILLRFTVIGSGPIPPDGTEIDLDLTDQVHAGTVSAHTIVQSAPRLNLQLSSEQGTVAPGANYTYTLAASNVSGGPLPQVTLSVPVRWGLLSSQRMAAEC
jgi:hypothetical protein